MFLKNWQSCKELLRKHRAAVILVLIWATEAFIVQALTLHPGHDQTVPGRVLDAGLRFGLNILACGMAYCALPRLAIAPVLLVELFFNVGAVVYYEYYDQPLSMMVMLHQTGEGVAVAGAFLSLITPVYGLLAVSTCVKIWLFLKRPALQRRWWLVAFIGVYVLTLGLLDHGRKPFRAIARWQSVGDLGYVYGYGPTFMAQVYFIDNRAMLANALARSEEGSDRLKDQAPIEVGDCLVFLQVESLDRALLGFRIDDEEVTPELNLLSSRSAFFSIRSDHGTGSSDADFKALMGRLPSSEIPTYKIAKYPYDGSFVAALRERGYFTSSIHGVTGEFFNRRSPYEAMGFDRIEFREEFVDSGAYDGEGWTVPDAQLLEHSAAEIRQHEGRQFRLIITASCHIPFPVEPERRHFFRQSTRNNERYFDSIHSTDQAIGEFARALPHGAVLVIYGDHASKIVNEAIDYQEQEYDGIGLVPFLVYQVGGDLSSLELDSEVADSGELTLLDAVMWIQRSATEGAFPR